ncbi:hypothetical protein K8M07_05030 [Schnuerera sp. xch1]|uniref:CAP domain-containing protein n=1 Tax=Schnuerera sp. xch1 TaxID=2874283 RepID=UPI001CBE8607|nr:CAP domain-containing protein [Schnuerera sp. xch1]MBZ2174607.1 hypothetical protein [Schnuerera sp. xch1]
MKNGKKIIVSLVATLFLSTAIGHAQNFNHRVSKSKNDNNLNNKNGYVLKNNKYSNDYLKKAFDSLVLKLTPLFNLDKEEPQDNESENKEEQEPNKPEKPKDNESENKEEQEPNKPEKPKDNESENKEEQEPCKPEKPEDNESENKEEQQPCKPEKSEDNESENKEEQEPSKPEKPEDNESENKEEQEPCKPEKSEDNESENKEEQQPSKPEKPEDNESENKEEQDNQTPDDNTSSVEKEVVRLVNIEREKAGLAPLTHSAELSKVARAKSQDMADKNYFSHNSPTYGDPFAMMKEFGIDYGYAGENIAKGQKSAESVVEGWMNSTGHRENILNPNFNKIGVGYVESNGTTYWTQMFTD